MTDVFIGKYKVIRKLGAGGMASVYLASHRDVPSLRTVLKELGDIQLADRFRREADKLAQLDGHGGICQIKHFFEDGGKFYIVMEYIEGPTLDELVRSDDPPDLLRCVDITRAILSTLDFAHRMGVVHRDIKPTNIMIDRIGQVKIIDFGIAKGAADPDLTQVGASLGSPRYMAPEQFNAAAAIDWVRCDIYAVGVTLYFLLTRDFPFKGASIHEMCEAKRLGMVEPPSRLNPAIPPWLEAVVLKAMATDPADRYATAAEMRAALDDPGPGYVPPPIAHDGTMVLGPDGAAGATTATRTPPPARPRPAPTPAPVGNGYATMGTGTGYGTSGASGASGASGITGTMSPPAPPPGPTFADRVWGSPGRRLAVIGAAVAVLAAVALLLWPRGPAGPPPAPTLVAPADGAVLPVPQVEFRWADRGAADVPHAVQLAADSTFAGARTLDGGTGNAVRTPDALADGAWFWRVRAVPEGGAAGPWSAVGRFRVRQPAPVTATLVVAIEPDGAELSVDGNSVGTISGPRTLTLAPGPHELVARLPGSIEKTLRRKVDLAAGANETLDPAIRFHLPPPPPAENTYSLTIVAQLDGQPIPGATVEIDGKIASDAESSGGTPYVAELTAGSHHVVIRKNIDGVEWIGAHDLVVQKGVNGPVRIPLTRKR